MPLSLGARVTRVPLPLRMVSAFRLHTRPSPLPPPPQTPSTTTHRHAPLTTALLSPPSQPILPLPHLHHPLLRASPFRSAHRPQVHPPHLALGRRLRPRPTGTEGHVGADRSLWALGRWEPHEGGERRWREWGGEGGLGQRVSPGGSIGRAEVDGGRDEASVTDDAGRSTGSFARPWTTRSDRCRTLRADVGFVDGWVGGSIWLLLSRETA